MIKTILKHQKLILYIAGAAVAVAAYEAYAKRRAQIDVATVSPAASGLKGFASPDVTSAADLSSYDGLTIGSGATGTIPRTLANVNNGLGYDAIPLASYGFLSDITLH